MAGSSGHKLKMGSVPFFAEPAGDGAGEGTEDEGEDEGAGAAADEFAVVGGCILDERVGHGSEDGARHAVEKPDERTGEDAAVEIGQDTGDRAGR